MDPAASAQLGACPVGVEGMCIKAEPVDTGEYGVSSVPADLPVKNQLPVGVTVKEEQNLDDDQHRPGPSQNGQVPEMRPIKIEPVNDGCYESCPLHAAAEEEGKEPESNDAQAHRRFLAETAQGPNSLEDEARKCAEPEQDVESATFSAQHADRVTGENEGQFEVQTDVCDKEETEQHALSETSKTVDTVEVAFTRDDRREQPHNAAHGASPEAVALSGVRSPPRATVVQPRHEELTDEERFVDFGATTKPETARARIAGITDSHEAVRSESQDLASGGRNIENRHPVPHIAVSCFQTQSSEHSAEKFGAETELCRHREPSGKNLDDILSETVDEFYLQLLGSKRHDHPSDQLVEENAEDEAEPPGSRLQAVGVEERSSTDSIEDSRQLALQGLQELNSLQRQTSLLSEPQAVSGCEAAMLVAPYGGKLVSQSSVELQRQLSETVKQVYSGIVADGEDESRGLLPKDSPSEEIQRDEAPGCQTHIIPDKLTEAAAVTVPVDPEGTEEGAQRGGCRPVCEINNEEEKEPVVVEETQESQPVECLQLGHVSEPFCAAGSKLASYDLIAAENEQTQGENQTNKYPIGCGDSVPPSDVESALNEASRVVKEEALHSSRTLCVPRVGGAAGTVGVQEIEPIVIEPESDAELESENEAEREVEAIHLDREFGPKLDCEQDEEFNHKAEQDRQCAKAPEASSALATETGPVRQAEARSDSEAHFQAESLGTTCSRIKVQPEFAMDLKLEPVIESESEPKNQTETELDGQEAEEEHDSDSEDIVLNTIRSDDGNVFAFEMEDHTIIPARAVSFTLPQPASDESGALVREIILRAEYHCAESQPVHNETPAQGSDEALPHTQDSSTRNHSNADTSAPARPPATSANVDVSQNGGQTCLPVEQTENVVPDPVAGSEAPIRMTVGTPSSVGREIGLVTLTTGKEAAVSDALGLSAAVPKKLQLEIQEFMQVFFVCLCVCVGGGERAGE